MPLFFQRFEQSDSRGFAVQYCFPRRSHYSFSLSSRQMCIVRTSRSHLLHERVRESGRIQSGVAAIPSGAPAARLPAATARREAQVGRRRHEHSRGRLQLGALCVRGDRSAFDAASVLVGARRRRGALALVDPHKEPESVARPRPFGSPRRNRDDSVYKRDRIDAHVRNDTHSDCERSYEQRFSDGRRRNGIGVEMLSDWCHQFLKSRR